MDHPKSSPLVSINIATYNRAPFIAQALASIKQQTFSDWEVIIVDDASTDNTAEIVAPFLVDPRFHYCRNEHNMNISFTRNRALHASSGQYIAILDSDDFWCDQTKLQKQLDYLLAHPSCAVVGTAAKIVDASNRCLGEIHPPLRSQTIRRTILWKNPLVHSSVLYRKDKVLEVGGYQQALNGIEDYNLWLNLGVKNDLANLPELATGYRRHQTNVSILNRRQLMALNLKLIESHRADYPGYLIAWSRRQLRLGLYHLWLKLKS